MIDDGYDHAGLPTKFASNPEAELTPSLARFILNLPQFDRNEQKQKEVIAKAERELELLDWQESELT